jgi:hypothetical protein
MFQMPEIIAGHEMVEITNYKSQITNKSQISIFNDQNIHWGWAVVLHKSLSLENYVIRYKCLRIRCLNF